MNIEITVLGIPKGLARPRFARRGKFVRTYDPEQNVSAKESLIVQARDKAPDKLIDGPVHLQIHFHMPRPKGHYKTGKNAGKLKESAMFEQHTKKPDLDNLIKTVKDAFTGIFWKDDSQINYIEAAKEYGEQPRTEITIMSE